MNALSVDVQAETGDPGLPSAAQIETWLAAALAADDADGELEVAVRLVDEAESRALNVRYRGKDNSTNVLSFPFEAPAGWPAEAPRPLGDLVICAPLVASEAAAQGKARLDHWAHLVIHGTLHLLGYDHEDAADAERMESLEIRVLAGLGIENPYLAP